jgi:hypothetical protein
MGESDLGHTPVLPGSPVALTMASSSTPVPNPYPWEQRWNVGHHLMTTSSVSVAEKIAQAIRFACVLILLI